MSHFMVLKKLSVECCLNRGMICTNLGYWLHCREKKKKIVLGFAFEISCCLGHRFARGSIIGTSLKLSCTYRTMFCLQTCITVPFTLPYSGSCLLKPGAYFGYYRPSVAIFSSQVSRSESTTLCNLLSVLEAPSIRPSHCFIILLGSNLVFWEH